jgi:hypothetical protein
MVAREPKVGSVQKETVTVSADEVMRDPDIRIVGPGYPLGKSDYLILTAGRPKLAFMANTVFGIALLLGLEIVCRFLISKINGTEFYVEEWKMLGVMAASGACVFLFLVSRVFPKEKKELLKKMKRHFDTGEVSVESHPKYKTSCRRY